MNPAAHLLNVIITAAARGEARPQDAERKIAEYFGEYSANPPPGLVSSMDALIIASTNAVSLRVSRVQGVGRMGDARLI